ncbi:extracellular signal-regulated kinase 7 isoform X2 [Teleopsis dalmanni]|uniref:extracellular signal-regulated kinase 7 isoform X2 n=1 Tax=Teleopsis dalmanni TaxID=139649 RepID=UPI0018CFA644|nr:extracellular signal-regulated kinase 7 isoform X2 [Teleopsis dalmanni]
MANKQKSSQDKNKMCEVDDNISKIFDFKKRLGKGAYGVVWKAVDKRTNGTVAVKKIFDAFRDETDAQRTFREIIFLNAFRSHPNVVSLHNVYKASNNLDIYLIFEFMESDLHNIIKKGHILKDVHKRYVMYQLLNAVKYLHSGNVIHRDLKPSNVLIDSKCRCKLADFGLARSVSFKANRGVEESNTSEIDLQPLLTDYVATRWYRAPEILVASKRYTKGIDMWSLGCILGEMLRGKPLFQGTSTVNQIEKIINALPKITQFEKNALGVAFGSSLLDKQSTEKKTSLDELLYGASKDGIDMVKKLLVFDPFYRLNAAQALDHSYVERFRSKSEEQVLNMDIVPPVRDDVRLTVPEYRSKLYEIVQNKHEKPNHLRQNLYGSKSGNVKQREHKVKKSTEYIEPTGVLYRNTKSSQQFPTDGHTEKDVAKPKKSDHIGNGAIKIKSNINSHLQPQVDLAKRQPTKHPKPSSTTMNLSPKKKSVLSKPPNDYLPPNVFKENSRNANSKLHGSSLENNRKKLQSRHSIDVILSAEKAVAIKRELRQQQHQQDAMNKEKELIQNKISKKCEQLQCELGKEQQPTKNPVKSKQITLSNDKKKEDSQSATKDQSATKFEIKKNKIHRREVHNSFEKYEKEWEDNKYNTLPETTSKQEDCTHLDDRLHQSTPAFACTENNVQPLRTCFSDLLAESKKYPKCLYKRVDLLEYQVEEYKRDLFKYCEEEQKNAKCANRECNEVPQATEKFSTKLPNKVNELHKNDHPYNSFGNPTTEPKIKKKSIKKNILNMMHIAAQHININKHRNEDRTKSGEIELEKSTNVERSKLYNKTDQNFWQYDQNRKASKVYR